MTFTVDTGISLAVLLGIVFQIIHGTRRAGRQDGRREEFEINIKKAVDIIGKAHMDCHETLPEKFYPKERGIKLELCVDETKKRINEHETKLAKLEVRPCP